MKKRLGVLLLLGLLMAFGLAIPNLYSQSQQIQPAKQTTTFWQRIFGKTPVEKTPLETAKSSAAVKPFEMQPLENTAFKRTGILDFEQEQIPPAAALPPVSVVVSPTLDPGLKGKFDNWVKNFKDQQSIHVWDNWNEWLKKAASDKTYNEAVLIGDFDFPKGTIIQNWQIWGVSKSVAEKWGFAPTRINIRGETLFKNSTEFNDVTLNLWDNLVLADSAKVRNSDIFIKNYNSSVILAGSPGTALLGGVNILCMGAYDPADIAGRSWSMAVRVTSAGYIATRFGDTRPGGMSMIPTAESHSELINNGIANCSIGVYVDPNSRLTATYNEIHDTIFGIWFARCTADGSTCASSSVLPPRGTVGNNTITSSKVGIFIESGRPSITPNNTWSAGSGMQIALLNTSAETMGDTMLNAHPNNWLFPLSSLSDSSLLSATFDSYSGYDRTTGLTYESIIRDGRNPKNVVNIGGRGEGRMPQTLPVGCSLIK